MSASGSETRAVLRQQFGMNLYKVKSGFYTITGVAFIDKVHGQLGHADNGIEIHPVLSIVQAP